MKVRIIRNSFRDCPADLKGLGFSENSIVRFRVGAEAQVLAVSLFSGTAFLLVVDELDSLVWLPSFLFLVVDAKLPGTWSVGLHDDNPSMIIGPEIIASDLAAYRRLVEYDADMVDRIRSQK